MRASHPNAESVGTPAGADAGLHATRRALVILVFSSVILTLSMGIRHSFGLFLQPMTTDLGWGRESFALAIAVQNLVWGASQPFFGWFADRHGARRVLLVGGLFYAAGVALMASAATPAAYTLAAGLLVGLGLGGTTFAVILGVVGRAYPPAKQANAFAVVTAAGSFGQFILVPVAMGLIGGTGWYQALLIFALAAAVIMPLAMGATRNDQQTNDLGPAQSTGAALRQAFSHKGFWLLTGGFFACGFQLLFIAAHLPAYLVDKGLDPKAGMLALALIGLFNIFGSFFLGRLGLRYRRKYILSIIYFARTLVIAAFLLVPVSTWSVALFGAAMGFLWLGTVPLTNGILARIFGTRYMSMLFGITFFSHQLGSFLGGWLGGWVFDLTHSYDIAWTALLGVGLVAALINLPIDEQPAPLPAVPQ